MPVWVLQGERDCIVPPRYSRALVQAIRAAGNRRIRYSEYQGIGHNNAWDRTYADPKVIAWLLTQRR